MIWGTPQIMSARSASWRNSSFTLHWILPLAMTPVYISGVMDEQGAEWSKAFAISQGCPFFLASFRSQLVIHLALDFALGDDACVHFRRDGRAGGGMVEGFRHFPGLPLFLGLVPISTRHSPCIGFCPWR